MTIEEILIQLKNEGWCVIDEVIPAGEVGAVRDSVIATVKAAEATEDPTRSLTVARGSLINLDQSFAPYLTHPNIVGVAESLWGSTSRSPSPRRWSISLVTSPRDGTQTGRSTRSMRGHPRTVSRYPDAYHGDIHAVRLHA